MLVKILGGIDLLFGGILIFGLFTSFPAWGLFVCGGILFSKSCFGMLKDFPSWIDFLGGLLFILSTVISFPEIVYLLGGISIIQKGIFSFF